MQYLEKPKSHVEKITTALALSIPCAALMLDASAQAADVIVALGKAETLGSMLTDAQGKTLYVVLSDSKNGEEKRLPWQPATTLCQGKFMPLAADSRPHARNAVQGLLSTTQGANGKSQATFNGWPLYVYVHDTKAGDVDGQGYQNVAYAVNPAGWA